MKKTVLFALLAFGLTACAEYTPSEANCFSFVSRGPGSDLCNFTPLEGAEFNG